MKSYSDLLDVDTWAQVRNAAPKVTAVPGDTARVVVQSLGTHMRRSSTHEDLTGRKYWEASLGELIEDARVNIEPKFVGQALRAMGLTLWREGDGYHVAWSEEQFKILKKHLRA
jgi:hypothetical protein